MLASAALKSIFPEDAKKDHLGPGITAADSINEHSQYSLLGMEHWNVYYGSQRLNHKVLIAQGAGERPWEREA
jgi:hypothetical protein